MAAQISPRCLGRKPIAIPASNAAIGSPFLRAYPVILHGYGISPAVFIAFIDELNQVAAASPPTRILSLVGQVVSVVPLHTTQLVGSVVQASADVATYSISKGRTEQCLEQANKALFGPVGLQADIAKLDALALLAGFPAELFDDAGHIRKHASMLGGLRTGDDSSEASLVTKKTTVQQRRLQALEPWLEPLDVVDWPPALAEASSSGSSGDGFMERMDGFAASMAERERRRLEASLVKNRDKVQAKYQKDRQKAQVDYDKKVQKLAQKAADADSTKKAEKLEREKKKVEEKLTTKMRKAERDLVKEDKEEKVMRKILWLVIRPNEAWGATV